MAKWTVTDRIPKGLPKNLPAYVWLGLSAFVILAMVLTTDTGTPVPPEDSGPLDGPAVSGSDVEGVMSALSAEAERARRLRAELEREQTEADRRRREEEDRRLAEEREQDRLELQAAREALMRATQLREQSGREDLPPDRRRELLGMVGSVEEEQLREAMRLAEVERFANSMRAPAMVGPVMAQAAPVPPAAPAPRESDLERLVRLAREAESAEGAAGPSSGGPPPGAPPLRGDSTPSGGAAMTVQAAAGGPVDVYPPLGPAGVTEQSGAGSAAVARWGGAPEGADLVYEGRMLQATLQTQLSGEFTGPVRALVSIPVWSRDRRRVVIPRGTLALGEAQQVSGAFQGRLAVGFDRLVFPDGRTVRMSFAGLNAIGETGLADEVNRHYVSTFGAVGAVGLLAGLVRGGGGDSYYDPVSQQFALTATQLFDRYMNRLPEITIRAGHPMRIWLTQDLIVPRGDAGRERGLG